MAVRKTPDFETPVLAQASIGIAADSYEIVAFDPTDKEVPDASHVGPLLEQGADALASLMSVGAYDRAHVVDAILAKNPAVGFIVCLYIRSINEHATESSNSDFYR